MAQNLYDLKLMLVEKEYVAGVRAALESKVKIGLFKKDKEVVELLNAYNAGKATLDQAQRILARVVLLGNEMAAKPSAGSVGSFAILRGATRKLAEVVQGITEEEKARPDGDSDEITCRVLARRFRD